MPSRLLLLARKAGAVLASRVPLIAYLLAASLATTGAGVVYWPAAFFVAALFCLAVAAL